MLILVPLVSTLLSIYSGECETLPLAPALFSFGDSLVDNGNNHWLPNPPIGGKNDYSPYGVDFKNGTATGRATNGRNVADFIAEYLMLPKYPPPFMQPHDESPSRIGYNYASAGCGIIPIKEDDGCMPLGKQVNLFETTVKTELSAWLEPAELEEYLSNSIFYLWMGNNDYLVNYFAKDSAAGKLEPHKFADLLIETLSDNLKRLYNLGARKIVLFEISVIGCMPMNRLGDDKSCDTSKSANATIYNEKLSLLIQNLSANLENSYFTHGKTYDLTYDAITNPEKYGLTNVKDPCCRIILMPCIPSVLPFWVNACEDRTEHLFWDAAHPTETGHSTLAAQCITHSSVCTPMSIEQLVAVKPKPASLHSSA